jgi:hypothetical protein
MKTAVALYDAFVDARGAVEALIESGYESKEISVIAPDDMQRELQDEAESQSGEVKKEEAKQGTGVGAFLGSLAGVQAAIIALAIPGVGPLLATGAVGAAITGGAIGAAAGAAAGGLVGGLTQHEVPEEYARLYAEGVRRGATLVALKVEDDEAARVKAMMDRHNPINIDARVEQWKAEGWTPPQASPGALSENEPG